MASKKNPKSNSLQMPLWVPQSDWTTPIVAELPEWGNAKRVAIDVETKDPGIGLKMGPAWRHGGYIVGIGFAIEDGPAFYVPLRHKGGDNVPNTEAALQYFRDQAKSYKGIIVGANINYDLDYLLNEGISFPMVKWVRDVQVADPLINELHMSYSLQNISLRWGFTGKDETLLREAAQQYGIDPKADMWKLPARFVGEYGEEDCRLPLQILRKQERAIDDEDLWQVYDLESELTPVLVRVRRRGVRVNADKLSQIESWSLSEEAQAVNEIRRLTGFDIGMDNIHKADVLLEPLKSIGADIGKTATGKANIDKFVLSSIDHPVADAILWARKVNKLRTTFAASVRRYMVNGRIHCTFNQLRFEKDDESGTKGAAYGRMSCEHPNLQQQPSRDEFASMWRAIYEPEEGSIWSCNDYSQQEPRWTTHYAELAKCRGARTMGDAYRNDPNTDNHDMMTTLIYGITREDTPEEKFEKIRKPCKDIYLGLCYGMGGAKLAREIGKDTRFVVSAGRREKYYRETRVEAQELAASLDSDNVRIWEAAGEEAQEILDRFEEKAPFVKQLSEKAQRSAKKKGYIKTAGGRHCRFPVDAQGNYDWTHKALNRLIQGSAGDQTKRALIEVDRAGHFVQLAVHDETDSSVADNKEAMQITEIMERCVPMTVPSKIDTEVGPNWGELTKI